MTTNGASKHRTSAAALEDLLAIIPHPTLQWREGGREQYLPDRLEVPVELPGGHQPVTEQKIPVPQAQEANSAVYQTTPTDYLCVGELVFSPDTDPVDVVRMWKGLEGNLKAEMLSMNHSSKGITVKCAVADLALLLGWLATKGNVVSWSFTTPGERARTM